MIASPILSSSMNFVSFPCTVVPVTSPQQHSQSAMPVSAHPTHWQRRCGPTACHQPAGSTLLDEDHLIVVVAVIHGP